MIEGRDIYVRWDAVVDRAATGADTQVPSPSLRVPESSARSIPINVQLFGALAAAGGARSCKFELSAPATVADALAVLKERLGERLTANMLDHTGAKRRHCRLFVNGHPVEDVRAPLPASGEPAEIEIILLIAPEGG